jgi:prepilin peptidase CpaA
MDGKLIMTHPFFPDAWFAWTFYVVLVGITLIACYTDVRRMIVPKWLTVPALGLGVVFNVIRGAWLGALVERGAGWGALDGLLFSLKGFGIGFGLFFFMWVCGVCRGGDVKLFAALGAWLGFTLSIVVLMGTVATVIVFLIARLLWRLFVSEAPAVGESKGKAKAMPLNKRDYEEAKRFRKRMVYSPALAVSTALLVFWHVHRDLHPRAAPPEQSPVEQRG